MTYPHIAILASVLASHLPRRVEHPSSANRIAIQDLYSAPARHHLWKNMQSVVQLQRGTEHLHEVGGNKHADGRIGLVCSLVRSAEDRTGILKEVSTVLNRDKKEKINIGNSQP